MMMQMLGAAGLEIATDGLRGADVDNPNGYFELEAVKRLEKDASFLGSVVGRVLKVVAPLLSGLSADYDYRIVFMERNLDEIMESQRAMLERLDDIGGGGGPATDAALVEIHTRLLRTLRTWLLAQDNMRTCYVSHREVIDEPVQASRAVVDFLEETGAFRSSAPRPGELIARRMAEAVDDRLHRHR